MEQHLQEKAEEAAAMYEAMTAKAPRWDNGLVEQPHRREAEEQVFAALMELPPENP